MKKILLCCVAVALSVACGKNNPVSSSILCYGVTMVDEIRNLNFNPDTVYSSVLFNFGQSASIGWLGDNYSGTAITIDTFTLYLKKDTRIVASVMLGNNVGPSAVVSYDSLMVTKDTLWIPFKQ